MKQDQDGSERGIGCKNRYGKEDNRDTVNSGQSNDVDAWSYITQLNLLVTRPD